MRGHVRKRGNTWCVVYDEGRGENGRRVQRWVGGFKTQKEAQGFLTETLGAIGKQTYVPPSPVTLGDYLTKEWLPALEASDDVRPLTQTTYASVVRTRIKVPPWLWNLPLQAVQPAHVKRLLGELVQEGRSESTRKLTRAVLSGAFTDAVEDRKVAGNPVAVRSRRRGSAGSGKTTRRATAWSARELRSLLEHVAGDRLFALWRLAATSGMRRGELLGLTWRCLDLGGARLDVEQQLVPTRGGATFGPPKSARSHRTIALDPDTVAALRRHREAQKLERAFAGDAYVDRDLVFADELGGPIHPQRLTEWFDQHRKAAGLMSGSLHRLRHTHATHLLTSGTPLHVAAARLGDAPNTILRVYAHLLPTSDEEAANRAAALIA
jgi:integrase